MPEAKNWLADAKYEDKHQLLPVNSEITVDEWFEFWKTNLLVGLSWNTIRNYNERYQRNIKPVIGRMKMVDVKPMHSKLIFNQMMDDYAGSTIRQTYITMGVMFRAAIDNGIILKHPLDGVKFSKPVRASSDIKFLSREEQEAFLEVAKCSHNYYQYMLILETGLRTGEMIGLTWDVIDWEKRTLTINKTMEFRYKQKFWRAGPPKSISSYRTIPLTNRAYTILRILYEARKSRKESEQLNQTLEFIDRKTGLLRTMNLKDLVFVNYRTGMPAKNSSYDTHLYKLCDEAGIKRFCMHALRHTYATRAIEAGVQPKVLQKLLGHSSIQMTMDRYVHVTEESMLDAIQAFEMGKQKELKVAI